MTASAQAAVGPTTARIPTEFDEYCLPGPQRQRGQEDARPRDRGGIGAVPDAPASMQRPFEESERDPHWLERDRMLHGAKTFRRVGPAAFSFAGVSTLLAYTENPIVKPLALTGAYAGDTALNRFMETARTRPSSASTNSSSSCSTSPTGTAPCFTSAAQAREGCSTVSPTTPRIAGNTPHNHSTRTSTSTSTRMKSPTGTSSPRSS
jgi:hypothetical protein